MHALNITKKQLIEAPKAGPGPRWIAELSDGRRVVGMPSWMGNSGNVPLPNHGQPRSDWQRLKEYCLENAVHLVGLSLMTPPNGIFTAPKNLAGYGYFERQVTAMKKNVPARGVEALAICYPSNDGERDRYKVELVYAKGVYEVWWRDQPPPCMICHG